MNSGKPCSGPRDRDGPIDVMDPDRPVFRLCPTCREPLTVRPSADPHTVELRCAGGHLYWVTTDAPVLPPDQLPPLATPPGPDDDPEKIIIHWLATPESRVRLVGQVARMLLRCFTIFRGEPDRPGSSFTYCPACGVPFERFHIRGDWALGLRCSCPANWHERSGIWQRGGPKLEEYLTAPILAQLIDWYLQSEKDRGLLTHTRGYELHCSVLSVF